MSRGFYYFNPVQTGLNYMSGRNPTLIVQPVWHQSCCSA